MFGIFKTRKQRHFELYCAIYSQYLLISLGEPDTDKTEAPSEFCQDAWEDAHVALAHWERLNRKPPYSFPRQ